MPAVELLTGCVRAGYDETRHAARGHLLLTSESARCSKETDTLYPSVGRSPSSPVTRPNNRWRMVGKPEATRLLAKNRHFTHNPGCERKGLITRISRFNDRCLQCYREPATILPDIDSSKSVIAAVVLSVFHALLVRTARHDSSVSVHPDVQVRNLTRLVFKRS